MASNRFLLDVLAVFLLALATASIADGFVVNTTAGTVGGQGVDVNGTAVRQYLGIPYAETPVRFSPPVAKAPWNASEKYDASYYRPSCPQKAKKVSDFVPAFMLMNSSQMLQTSEDCLHLNVYTPANATDQHGPRAVLVWFHGGSYRYGTGNAFEPLVLAAKGGILIVTINYRLGPFGFLQTDDGMAAPGNLGLLDQQLALKWVKDNIEGFGGDPNRVTIAGQAGVHGSASLHMFVPESRPLFKRVVTHSGVFRPKDLQKPEEAMSNTKLLAELAGCPRTPSADLLGCLRNKTTEEIMSYNDQLSMMKNSTFMWQPVFNTDFFTMDADASKMYDLVAAFNTGDGTIALKLIKDLFLSDAMPMPSPGVTDTKWDRWMKAYIGSSPVVEKAVEYQYTDRDIKNETIARVAAVVNAQSGRAFTRYGTPALPDLKSMLNSTRVVVFDHRSSADTRFPKEIPAPHGSEIPYIFGLPFALEDKFTDEERQLSQRMIKYWSNFVKTGNPNMDGVSGNATTMLPKWPEYGDEKEYLKVNAEKAEEEDAYRSGDVYFWSEYLPELKEVCPDPMPGPDSTNSPRTTYATDMAGKTRKPKYCPEPVLGKGMGLNMNVKQAESLIQALLILCLIMACLACLVAVVCIVYKPKPKQVSLDDIDSEEAIKPAGINGGVLHGGETSSAGTSGSPSHSDQKDKTIFEEEEAPIYAKSMKMKAADEDDTIRAPPPEEDNHTHVYANVAYRQDPEEIDDPEPNPKHEEEEIDIDEIFPPPPGDEGDVGEELDEIPPPYVDEDEPDDPQDADSETEINTKL